MCTKKRINHEGSKSASHIQCDRCHEEVEDCNFVSAVNFTVAERLNNCCIAAEIKAATFEELEDENQGLETNDINKKKARWMY